jgi:hypothetical protein
VREELGLPRRALAAHLARATAVLDEDLQRPRELLGVAGLEDESRHARVHDLEDPAVRSGDDRPRAGHRLGSDVPERLRSRRGDDDEVRGDQDSRVVRLLWQMADITRQVPVLDLLAQLTNPLALAARSVADQEEHGVGVAEPEPLRDLEQERVPLPCLDTPDEHDQCRVCRHIELAPSRLSLDALDAEAVAIDPTVHDAMSRSELRGMAIEALTRSVRARHHDVREPRGHACQSALRPRRQSARLVQMPEVPCARQTRTECTADHGRGSRVDQRGSMALHEPAHEAQCARELQREAREP